MSASGESEKRLILRRTPEAISLRALGITVYLSVLVLLLFSLSLNWQLGEWNIVFAVPLVFFLRGFLICIRELLRRVSLHEAYISFGFWSLTPRIYSYQQIAHVETVEIEENRWSLEPETYVKVVFDDGRVLKVQKSLMSVREFRRHLTKRAGRKFRKPSKDKKRLPQRS